MRSFKVNNATKLVNLGRGVGGEMARCSMSPVSALGIGWHAANIMIRATYIAQGSLQTMALSPDSGVVMDGKQVVVRPDFFEDDSSVRRRMRCEYRLADAVDGDLAPDKTFKVGRNTDTGKLARSLRDYLQSNNVVTIDAPGKEAIYKASMAIWTAEREQDGTLIGEIVCSPSMEEVPMRDGTTMHVTRMRCWRA